MRVKNLSQRGMSLIELMVALGLGVFLILGVVNVFVSNKDSTQVETSLARLQENGRIALDILAGEVRDAMFIGCTSANRQLTVMADSADPQWMQGYERTSVGWSPALDASLAAINTQNRVGSDVIDLARGVRIGTGVGLQASANVGIGNANIPVTANSECLQSGDQVMIANCGGTSLFEITNTPACDGSATTLVFGAGANTPPTLTAGYRAGDSLYRMRGTVWYVMDTGRTRLNGAVPVYALVRRTNGGSVEEIIEGVEYMQILYGQKLANGNLRYVPANDATLDMEQVVSLRIALLLQSFEPVLDADDTVAYQVLDQSIDSAGTTYTHNGDKTLRRVFTTTAILRNRDI